MSSRPGSSISPPSMPRFGGPDPADPNVALLARAVASLCPRGKLRLAELEDDAVRAEAERADKRQAAQTLAARERSVVAALASLERRAASLGSRWNPVAEALAAARGRAEAVAGGLGACEAGVPLAGLPGGTARRARTSPPPRQVWRYKKKVVHGATQADLLGMAI